MTVATAVAVPTSAERIRSACIRGQALLAIDDTADSAPVTAPVCHLLTDGSLAIAIPAKTALNCGSATSALLELTDHAPLRLRQRVRALVWIRGRLQLVAQHDVATLLDQIAAVDPNPALLQVISPRSTVRSTRYDDSVDHESDSYALARLTPESAVLADTTGTEAVDVDALLMAQPDPFCAIEAHWLYHLDSAHPDFVARLAAVKLPPRLRRGRARPLAVDRYGLWLRVENADSDHDVRLSFAHPVSDMGSLNKALRALLGCPFLNGLQARRD